MTDVLISLKLYKRLEKEANRMSKKIGRKVSVDEISNLVFQFGLENTEVLETAIEESKFFNKVSDLKKPHTQKPPKPETADAKRGEEFIRLTPLFVVKKEK